MSLFFVQTLICPHLVTERERIFSLPKHCTHIKVVRPKIKSTKKRKRFGFSKLKTSLHLLSCSAIFSSLTCFASISVSCNIFSQLSRIFGALKISPQFMSFVYSPVYDDVFLVSWVDLT